MKKIFSMPCSNRLLPPSFIPNFPINWYMYMGYHIIIMLYSTKLTLCMTMICLVQFRLSRSLVVSYMEYGKKKKKKKKIPHFTMSSYPYPFELNSYEHRIYVDASIISYIAQTTVYNHPANRLLV